MVYLPEAIMSCPTFLLINSASTYLSGLFQFLVPITMRFHLTCIRGLFHRSPFIFAIYTASLSEASVAPLSLSRHQQPSSSSFSTYFLASNLYGTYSAIGMMMFQQNSRLFHASPVKKLLSIVSLISFTQPMLLGPEPESFRYLLPLHLLLLHKAPLVNTEKSPQRHSPPLIHLLFLQLSHPLLPFNTFILTPRNLTLTVTETFSMSRTCSPKSQSISCLCFSLHI